MIERGKTICPDHGVIDLKDVIFYDRKNGVGIEVGKGGNDSDAKLFGTSRFKRVSIGRPAYQSGYIDSFIAEYYGTEEGNAVALSQEYLRSTDRICPKCYFQNKVTYLPYKGGFYPTYLLPMIGSPEVGKTVYQQSIMENLRERRTSGQDGICSYHYENGDNQLGGDEIAPEASPVSRDKMTVLWVKHKGKLSAQLLLMDTAGELTRYNGYIREDASKVLSEITNQADGFFLFCDPRAVKSADMAGYLQDKAPVKGDMNFLLDELAPGKGMPICQVMSGADRLHEIAAKHKGIHKDGMVEITEKSFLFKNVPPTPANIAKHCHLAKDLFCSLTDVASGAADAYFVISSGRDGRVGKQRTINYSETINLAFPIIWMANKLNLVEVKEVQHER